MKITKVICSKGRTGFFFDDQRAIKKGAVSDGAAYVGEMCIRDSNYPLILAYLQFLTTFCKFFVKTS